MRFFSANLESLRDLYIQQLQVLLSAERQIRDAFPDAIQKATDPQLKQAFHSHFNDTRQHVTRLEYILEEVIGVARPIHCDVLTALIAEGEQMTREISDDSVRDAALIAQAQRIEHYEIASYGTLRRFARILGETTQARMLDQTIKEEGHADQVLTEISSRVNSYAERAA